MGAPGSYYWTGTVKVYNMSSDTTYNLNKAEVVSEGYSYLGEAAWPCLGITHTLTRTHTYTRTHTHTDTSIHIHIHTRSHADTRIHTHTYIYTHVRAHSETHT